MTKDEQKRDHADALPVLSEDHEGACGDGLGREDVPRRGRDSSRRRPLSSFEVATYGVLASLALVCGYFETLVPLPIPVPGVKLGLGNIVVLYALLVMGARSGLIVMLVKVVASALLFGNPMIFAYSLAGAVTSYLLMLIASRLPGLSVMGISMVGGLGHMAGQLFVVGLVLTWQISLVYAPVLIVSGLASGYVVGGLCRLVIRATRGLSFVRERRKRLANG